MAGGGQAAEDKRAGKGKENCPWKEERGHHLPGTHIVKFSSMKQRLRSSPAHSCTPMMPKMKKTKKQRRRTFPSMGKVSRSKFTRMRMPAGGEKSQKEQVWDGGIERQRNGEKEGKEREKKGEFRSHTGKTQSHSSGAIQKKKKVT